MKFFVVLVVLALSAGRSAGAALDQEARWQRHAENVRIVRDNWGIAHIYGRTDADCVFGAIYAQAEDDFGRIERNYLNGLGMLAQAEGESAVYSDLRQRLFIDPRRLQEDYRLSPAWLKALMMGWSDGLNYFLSKHPAVTPKVIRHYRALDGAVLHRGQHRRRHREHRSCQVASSSTRRKIRKIRGPRTRPWRDRH